MENTVNTEMMRFNLKNARLVAGMTQADVSEALNISRATFISWENEPGKITIETLKRLGSLYNVPLSYFFGL